MKIKKLNKKFKNKKTKQKNLQVKSLNKIKGISKCTICLTEIKNKCDLKSKVKVYPKFFTD